MTFLLEFGRKKNVCSEADYDIADPLRVEFGVMKLPGLSINQEKYYEKSVSILIALLLQSASSTRQF